MTHPTPDELTAEAFGLATLEEHERVTCHLNACESCLEDFARRCSECGAIEEAAEPRPHRFRAWGAVAAAAMFLAAVALVLFHRAPRTETPGGAGIRGTTVTLTLAEGRPEEAALFTEAGRVSRQDGVLQLKGRVQLIRKNKPAVHATSAEIDYQKKSLKLDLAWPPGVDRAGLQDRPSPQITARNARSWKEEGKDVTDLADVSIKLLFGSQPVPGDVLLREVAVDIHADKAVIEKTSDERWTERWTMLFSGHVRILLPDGASLDCEDAGWDSGKSSVPTVRLRLE